MEKDIRFVESEPLTKAEKKDEKQPAVTSDKNNRWKYVMFFLIWSLSAWHLLTVKEKVLIKHDIVVNAYIPTSIVFLFPLKMKLCGVLLDFWLIQIFFQL